MLFFPGIKHRLGTARQQHNHAERHGKDEQIKRILLLLLLMIIIIRL